MMRFSPALLLLDKRTVINKILQVLLVLPGAVVCIAHAGDGMPTRPVQNGFGKSTNATSQAGTTFTLAVDKLPPRFAGADCGTIARKIRSLNVAKSEFETTAAYGARMSAMAGRALDGTNSFGSTLAFVEPPGGIESKYIADAGHLDVTAKWGTETQFIGNQSYATSIVAERTVSRNTAVMSNAFGASVKGTRSLASACTLAFANDGLWDESARAISALITMTAAEAKLAKPNLALLYVGTLTAPYLHTYSEHAKATFDRPHEVVWAGDTLVLNLAAVWLVNRATGKIYEKVAVGTANLPSKADAVAPKPEPARYATPMPMPAVVKHGGSIDKQNCKPKYPTSSKLNEETGTVTLSFLISPDGQVMESRLVRSSGFRDLDRAAMAALSKCRFQPAIEDDKSTYTWVDVRHSFDLDEL